MVWANFLSSVGFRLPNLENNHISLIYYTFYVHFYLFLSGTWSDDKASGVGKLEYSNGDVYEGQWDRDQRHGKSDTFCFVLFCSLVSVLTCCPLCFCVLWFTVSDDFFSLVSLNSILPL